MNGPRVTVFTTLYNVAEYLPRFLECMSRQTYTEYILLIVDDGSEDSTLEICRAYAERDSRVQIIHTEHRGLAPAKITAIASLRTPLAVSVDGDDVYEPGYLEHLVSARDKYDADLVISRVAYRDENYKKTGELVKRGELLIVREDFPKMLPMLLEDRRLNYLYAKIFRTELLKQCQIDDDVLQGSDTIYCCQYFTKAKNLVLIDDLDTNYIKYTSRSITSYHGKDEFQRLCRVNKTITEIFRENGFLSDEVQRVIDGRVFQAAGWVLDAQARLNHLPIEENAKIVYEMFHSDMYTEAYRRQEEAGNLGAYPFRVTDPGTVKAGSVPPGCRIIVSMTSYPERIRFVPKALNSIYRQTRKADEVILWLAEEQFPGKEKDLPEELIRDSQEGRLTIRWCDDLKSHKKYYYAFQEYRNDLVITVDDDLIYRPAMIGTLCRSYLLNPNAVSAVRGHLMLLEGSRILPYMMWLLEYSLHIGTPSMRLFSTSGAGTLHPVYLYDLETLDKEAFAENCLYADDIWLKLMQLSSGIPVVLSEKYAGLQLIPDTQESPGTLYPYNKTGNDEQLKRSIAWFDSKYGDGFILGKLKQTENEAYDFSGKEAVIEYYQEMLREKDRAMRQKTERLRKEKEQKEKEIRDLKNSMSFRLGRVMTKPGRTVRDLLKKSGL